MAYELMAYRMLIFEAGRLYERHQRRGPKREDWIAMAEGCCFERSQRLTDSARRRLTNR